MEMGPATRYTLWHITASIMKKKKKCLQLGRSLLSVSIYLPVCALQFRKNLLSYHLTVNEHFQVR